jgi:hypothetical protein
MANSACDLVSARILGKGPGAHFHWLTDAHAAYKHCNSPGLCLYNGFPLKFDPLRPRLAKPASARKTVVKELSS